MKLIEKLDLKFKEFLNEKNKQKAQSISVEILSLLDKEKFPVHKSLKNNETPYAIIFENYLKDFYSERNPNVGTLEILHNSILNLLLSAECRS